MSKLLLLLLLTGCATTRPTIVAYQCIGVAQVTQIPDMTSVYCNGERILVLTKVLPYSIQRDDSVNQTVITFMLVN